MTTENTDAQIASALRAVAQRESVTDIYFVACGGSYAHMLPNQYTVDREATQINGIALNAAEFKARAPKRLGKTSVVQFMQASISTARLRSPILMFPSSSSLALVRHGRLTNVRCPLSRNAANV